MRACFTILALNEGHEEMESEGLIIVDEDVDVSTNFQESEMYTPK